MEVKEPEGLALQARSSSDTSFEFGLKKVIRIFGFGANLICNLFVCRGLIGLSVLFGTGQRMSYPPRIIEI
jgi:hypothetical protein